MRLSSLQKFILLECLNSRTGIISRYRLNSFYNKTNKQVKKELRTKIITKSIERLIDKELMVGFGERTSYKWFIKEIKLTLKGKRVAKKLLGEQMEFKFKKNFKNNTKNNN